MAVHLRSSPSQSLLLFHSAPVPPRPIGAGISWAASPRSLKRTTRRFHAAPRKVAKTSIVASGSGHGRKLLRQRAEDWSAGVPVRDISGRPMDKRRCRLGICSKRIQSTADEAVAVENRRRGSNASHVPPWNSDGSARPSGMRKRTKPSCKSSRKSPRDH
jgi:hypothetical protein